MAAGFPSWPWIYYLGGQPPPTDYLDPLAVGSSGIVTAPEAGVGVLELGIGHYVLSVEDD